MRIACEDDDCGVLQDQLVAVVDPGTYFLAVQARRTSAVGPFDLSAGRASPSPPTARPHASRATARTWA
jgi:hypothetical protein